MNAGAGADVDEVISSADRIFVMFHHNHSVADITQVKQGFEQSVIVALVQADRGFIKNIHHTDQAGADLAGEADALRFATGQGVGAATQGQVVQAHINQKLQALLELFDNFFGNGGARTFKAELRKIMRGLQDGHLCDMRQVDVVNKHMTCIVTQPRAFTIWAGM